jgi:hypothetical protein
VPDAVNDDDLITLVWLCTNLVQLRADADRDGWRPRLDSAEVALRNGTSVTQVCRRLGLPVDPAPLRAQAGDSTRDLGPATLDNLVKPRRPVGGDYVCPYSSCDRRARSDRNGYEPVCVDGTPMLLSGR